MARIETDPNYTAPTFSRATAATDIFKKEDVQGVAAAMSLHDHSTGKGLPIASLAATVTIPSTLTLTGGNVEIAGSGRRILGDFNNATVANRLMFQNSALGSTFVGIIPNGTGTFAAVDLFNAADPTNAGEFVITINSVACILNASKQGTGAALPFEIQTSGIPRLSITAAGNAAFGGNLSAPNILGTSSVQIGASAGVFWLVWRDANHRIQAGDNIMEFFENTASCEWRWTRTDNLARVATMNQVGLDVTGRVQASGELLANGAGAAPAGLTLRMGGTGSGEGIGSNRAGGPHQFWLDFYQGSLVRAYIAGNGDFWSNHYIGSSGGIFYWELNQNTYLDFNYPYLDLYSRGVHHRSGGFDVSASMLLRGSGGGEPTFMIPGRSDTEVAFGTHAYVLGDLIAGGSVTPGSSSEKFKTVTETLTPEACLSLVLDPKVNPVRFTKNARYITDGIPDNVSLASLKAKGSDIGPSYMQQPETEIGFTAEAMDQVVPEVVARVRESGEPWGINYQNLVAVLWGATRSLDARVKQLEAAEAAPEAE